MLDNLKSAFTNLVEALLPQDLSQPTYSIWIDGEELNPRFTVASIMVRREMNRIPTARLSIYDGDPAEGTFTASNKGPFRPGAEVLVKAGYQFTDSTLFKGIVIRHGIKARGHKPSELCVELKSVAVRMTVGRKNTFFVDSIDSDVIDAVATPYGFTVDAEPTELEHERMVQFNATDWDFILSRAEKNGLLVNLVENTLFLQNPAELLEGDTFKTYNHNGDVFEMDAEMDARHQYLDIDSHAVSFDALEQTPEGPVGGGAAGGGLGGAIGGAVGEAASGVAGFVEDVKETAQKVASKIQDLTGIDLNVIPAIPITQEELAEAIGTDPYQLYHGGHLSADELQDWKEAQQVRSDLAFRRGRLRVQGDFRILPGMVIELSGFGVHFEGKLLVTGVSHHVNTSNYETEIQFGLDPEWFACEDDITATQAGGLLPAVNGLQVGVVTEVESDPASQYRVKVTLPLIDGGDDGIWAQFTTMYAGGDYGTFFYPEVGDQVILGFLNDDPRNAVVIGSVFDGESRQAPFDPSDKNYEKGIVTKGGHRLVFTEEPKKGTFTIETPKGNTITIKDGDSVEILDENKNSIKLNSDGITITSAKDVVIDASKGNFELKAKDITAEATVNAKMAGQNVNVEGTTTTNVKGGVLNLNS